MNWIKKNDELFRFSRTLATHLRRHHKNIQKLIKYL